MSYKSDCLIKTIRIDYLHYYEEYDEDYINNLDRFAESIQSHMLSEKFKLLEVYTNENETFIIDTSKIVSVRIVYK